MGLSGGDFVERRLDWATDFEQCGVDSLPSHIVRPRTRTRERYSYSTSALTLGLEQEVVVEFNSWLMTRKWGRSQARPT